MIFRDCLVRSLTLSARITAWGADLQPFSSLTVSFLIDPTVELDGACGLCVRGGDPVLNRQPSMSKRPGMRLSGVFRARSPGHRGKAAAECRSCSPLRRL